jgi:hypothetical protein
MTLFPPIHVIYSQGKWKVKIEGGKISYATVKTRHKALDLAEVYGMRHPGTKVYVHREDGTVEREV